MDGAELVVEERRRKVKRGGAVCYGTSACKDETGDAVFGSHTPERLSAEGAWDKLFKLMVTQDYPDVILRRILATHDAIAVLVDWPALLAAGEQAGKLLRHHPAHLDFEPSWRCSPARKEGRRMGDDFLTPDQMDEAADEIDGVASRVWSLTASSALRRAASSLRWQARRDRLHPTERERLHG